MLKFTYSETGIYLEHLPLTVERLVTERTVLAVRTQCQLLIEPCSASFLLPADLDQLQVLRQLAEKALDVVLSIADSDYVEVSVQGLWLCSEPKTVEGIFVLALAPELETLLAELWEVSQFCVPTALG